MSQVTEALLVLSPMAKSNTEMVLYPQGIVSVRVCIHANEGSAPTQQCQTARIFSVQRLPTLTHTLQGPSSPCSSRSLNKFSIKAPPSSISVSLSDKHYTDILKKTPSVHVPVKEISMCQRAKPKSGGQWACSLISVKRGEPKATCSKLLTSPICSERQLQFSLSQG